MKTAKDNDPGIYNYTRNRRIHNRLQLRNELLFRREQSSDTSKTLTLASTNSKPGGIVDINTIRRQHFAEGYNDIQFHYLITDTGQLYTGLELHEASDIASGIVIGIAGGLTSDGKVPATKGPSLYRQKQIESLVNLVGMFVTLYENVYIARNNVIRKQGMGPSQLSAPDTLLRVNKLITKGVGA